MLRPLPFILGLLLSSAGLSAQTPLPTGGTRLRIVTVERSITGLLVSEGSDSIVLRTGDGSTASVSRSDVRGVEQSLGWRSNAWRGAELGAGIGAAIGVLFGAMADTDGDSPAYRQLEKTGQIITNGGIGLAVGAVGGFAIGSRTRSERWRPRPAVHALIVTPSGAGLQLRF
ncbi:MAG TPA: hypothetical protein VF037_08125 [Gemmatimonadales bacterium]